MLQRLPPARVIHEWDAIAGDLARAIERDPGRTWMDVLGQAIAGELQFWEVRGPCAGYLASQITRESGSLRKTFWTIYAGGVGGDWDDMRSMLEIVEMQALNSKCTWHRFEGRAGWGRLFSDYNATRAKDGRWHYTKRLD